MEVLMSTQASQLPVMWARAWRNRAGGTRPLALVVLLVVTAMRLAPAHAGQDFLNRDGPLTPAYLYPDSDGGVESDTPDEDPWDVFVEEKKHDDTRWELPGPFSLLQTTPARQTLVGGPTFRNQKFRTEVGGAVGYVNAMWPRLPFQVSIETTWSRIKRVDFADRNFRRVRIATNAQVWRRSSQWEGTAISWIGFFQNQNTTFRTWETGLAASQVIGQRLSVTANGIWRRRYLVGGPVLDGAVGIFGTSYNFGGGVRFGGFYELFNQVDHADDWGMFLSYQFLPFAEFIVDGGKNQFVRARLLLSYVLERP